MSKGEKNVKHAKKQPEFYLSIWRLHVCGIDASGIAEALETSEPTVRRTLKRIRENQSPNIWRILFEAARDADVADLLNYEHVSAMLVNFFHGGQRFDFSKFHKCLTSCQTRLAPRDFAKSHIAYKPYVLGRYTLNFLEFEDALAVTKEIDKLRFCRNCPLGRYRDDALRPYQRNHHVYSQLMSYFSATRLRGPSERDLMLMHYDVLVIHMIHEIVLRRLQTATLNGASLEEIQIQTLEAFEDVTATLWDEIVQYI